MPKYLVAVSYTTDGIKGVKSKGGSARRAAAEELAKSVGGSLESFYFAFGDNDVYTVADLPDNTAAAALGLAVGAGAGARTKTIVLLTPEEMDSAASRDTAYRPPGG